MQSSANESNSDICSYDRDTNVFLSDLFEVISVVVSSVGILFLTPLAYGIVKVTSFRLLDFIERNRN